MQHDLSNEEKINDLHEKMRVLMDYVTDINDQTLHIRMWISRIQDRVKKLEDRSSKADTKLWPKTDDDLTAE